MVGKIQVAALGLVFVCLAAASSPSMADGDMEQVTGISITPRFWLPSIDPVAGAISMAVWLFVWLIPFWVLLGQRPKKTPWIAGPVAGVLLFGLWLERNLVRGTVKLDPAPETTTDQNLLQTVVSPSAWDAFQGPDSLYLGSKPSWWCNEACPFDLVGGIGAFGDDMTPGQEANLCKLPAQILHEGGTCTVSGSGGGGLSFPLVPTYSP